MRRSRHNALAILCSPRVIIGASLSQKPSSPQLQLHALFHKKLDHLELEQLTLFNPTAIGALIASWQTQSNAPLLCALHGPGLQEQMIFLHTPHPDKGQLPVSHAPHWQWHHTYLYSVDHQHCFYLCGIKKSILFQYQLMAINHNLPLSLLTTERMALLHCYKQLCGTTFRSSQLANDMTTYHNRVERLFFKDDLARILQIPSQITIPDDLILPLLTLCGLFNAQGTYE